MENGEHILQDSKISKKRNEYKKSQRLTKIQIMEELAKSNLVSSIAKNIVKRMFSKILIFLSPNNDDFKVNSEFIDEFVDEIPIVDDTSYDFFEKSSKILAVLYNPDFEEDIDIFTISDFKSLEDKEYKESEKNKILNKMLYEYYYITHPNERVEYRIQLNPYNFLSRRQKDVLIDTDELPIQQEARQENRDIPSPEKEDEIDELSGLFSEMFLDLEKYEKEFPVELSEEEPVELSEEEPVVEVESSSDSDIDLSDESISDDSSISSVSSSEEEEENEISEPHMEMGKRYNLRFQNQK